MSLITQAALDKVLKALRGFDVNPAENKAISETLANETAVTTTEYYYVDMFTFLENGFQLELASGAVVVTVEGSMQDDGTVQASCDYQDVTQAFGIASLIATGTLIDNTGRLALFKYVRIKVVSTAATFKIYHRRLVRR